jgi:hypothetical protein
MSHGAASNEKLSRRCFTSSGSKPARVAPADDRCAFDAASSPFDVIASFGHVHARLSHGPEIVRLGMRANLEDVLTTPTWKLRRWAGAVNISRTAGICGQVDVTDLA